MGHRVNQGANACLQDLTPFAFFIAFFIAL
jgi:hypothetical protein